MSLRNRKRIADKRRGQSLIMIFFALIVLIGIMALTLDYGFVLLARRQMQTGVNAAALEGLRTIDEDETEARQNAANLIRNVYDDDMDVTSNETTIGAGIDSSLVQGDGFQSVTLGDGNGVSSTLANRSQFVYRPDPQLNDADNLDHGDLVRGNYDGNAEHDERSSYQRDDFTAETSGNAFLARLRRTHNPNGLDQVSGVSSSGGGLPLMIGHLAWFAATDPLADNSIRRDGVTVRATAIASKRPVVAVFVTASADFYPILPYTIQVNASDGTEVWRDAVVEDMYVEDPENPPNPLSPRRVAIGKPVVVSGPEVTAPASPVGYGAVVDRSGRIVGFRFFPSAPGLRRNDSPRLQDAWGSLGLLSENARNEVLNENRDPSFDFLSAPALERSIR